MELIRVIKRGLREDGAADKYVKQMLINKVRELNVGNKEEVIKQTWETYDSNVIVTSLELIDEGIIDKALQAYINE